VLGRLLNTSSLVQAANPVDDVEVFTLITIPTRGDQGTKEIVAGAGNVHGVVSLATKKRNVKELYGRGIYQHENRYRWQLRCRQLVRRVVLEN